MIFSQMNLNGQRQPTFKIIKWNVIGCWASDGSQGNCQICKNQLTCFCNQCLAKNDPNNVCIIEQGTCRHAYHQHCLKTWFESVKNHNCLLCKTTWNAVKTREVRKSS